jgi:hypothetical protein
MERGSRILNLLVKCISSLMSLIPGLLVSASPQTAGALSSSPSGAGTTMGSQAHFPMLAVSDERGTSLPLFSPEAYRAEFRYIRDELKKIDLTGPAVQTDGATYNIPQAEWPFQSFSYFGYACANFAKYDPIMRDDALKEIRWLIDALQSPRMSGFVAPHFGAPFGANEIHVAVFVHGHFLNLALRYREISRDTRYDPLIHRIASALTREYLGTNGPILPSYRDMWWITDNFPALAGLSRYDRVFQRDSSHARDRFLTSMKTRYLDKSTGLFCTFVNPNGHIQEQGARGVSVMYGLHFLKDFDPDFAVSQYRLVKNCFVSSLLGLTVVREFPEGYSFQGDVASGPMVLGAGPAASGFAIAAAAVNGDDATAWELLKASALVGLPQLQNGQLRYNAMPTVGQAVILFGKSELLKSDVLLSAK